MSSYLGPMADQIVIDAGQLDRIGIVPPQAFRQTLDRLSRSKIMPRTWASRTMLCIQKKEATRPPRVTGVTMSRLGRAAVLPLRRIHDAAERGHLVFRQNVGDADQHDQNFAVVTM